MIRQTKAFLCITLISLVTISQNEVNAEQLSEKSDNSLNIKESTRSVDDIEEENKDAENINIDSGNNNVLNEFQGRISNLPYDTFRNVLKSAKIAQRGAAKSWDGAYRILGGFQDTAGGAFDLAKDSVSNFGNVLFGLM